MKRRRLCAGLIAVSALMLPTASAVAEETKIPGRNFGRQGCGFGWTYLAVAEPGGRLVYIEGFWSDFTDCV